jgi:hypothetical protein
MATIRTRERRDGSVAFLSEVRIKRYGETVHRESRTFDRRSQAVAWAQNREKTLAKKRPKTKRPAKSKKATLRYLLRKYREEISEIRPLGRS